MNFEKLQWLFPLAVTLHNGEEALSMPAWDVRHLADLPVHPPGAFEIRLALAGLTLAAFLVTVLSARRGPESVGTYLLFGYIVAMLANVFVPHIPAAILFRGYTPGVITAVLVNLPVMTLLVARAVKDRWVSGWKAVAFGVAIPVAMGGLVAAFVS